MRVSHWSSFYRRRRSHGFTRFRDWCRVQFRAGGEGLQGVLDKLGVKPELLQTATTLLGNEGGLQGWWPSFNKAGWARW